MQFIAYGTLRPGHGNSALWTGYEGASSQPVTIPNVKLLGRGVPLARVEHGAVMLAFHHGHMAKNASLPLLFAAQFPAVWGATTKRYAHCGHRHHVEEKEHAGMTVVQHPTLSARDAYAARLAFDAERLATVYTYHKDAGEVASATWTPAMLGL